MYHPVDSNSWSFTIDGNGPTFSNITPANGTSFYYPTNSVNISANVSDANTINWGTRVLTLDGTPISSTYAAWLECPASSSAYVSVSSVPLGSTWTIESLFVAPLPANANGWRTLARGSSHHPVLVDVNGYLGAYNNSGGGFSSSGYDMDNLTPGTHRLSAVGSGGTTTFYIDGNLVGTSSFQSTADIVAIGNYQGGGQPFGKISDFRVWNTARTQAEIQANKLSKLTGTESGLVGYWKMDEGKGSTVKDSTSNNRTGTLTNSPFWTTLDSKNGTLNAVVTNPTFGNHTLVLTIADTGGNTSSTTWTFKYVDPNPPVISNPSPSGVVVWGTGTNTFRADATDDVGLDCSTVRFKLDSGTYQAGTCDTANGKIVFSMSAEEISVGNHTAEFRVKDVGGNESVKTWTFTRRYLDESTRLPAPNASLEIVKPTISIQGPAGLPSDYYSINVQVDGQNYPNSYNASSGVISINPTIYKGTHTVTASISKPIYDGDWYSTWISGWTLLDSSTWNFTTTVGTPVTIDQQAPANGVTLGAVPALISARVTDSEGINANTIKLTVNGSVKPHIYDPATGTVSWVPAMGFGTYNVSLYAEDIYGVSATSNWTFYVKDLEPPALTSNAPTNGALVNGSASLSCTLSDLSGFDTGQTWVPPSWDCCNEIPGGWIDSLRVYLNGNTVTRNYSINGTNMTLTVPNPSYIDGINTVSVVVRDTSPQQNEKTYTWSFTVDKTAPTIGYTTPLNGAIFGYPTGTINVSAAISDNNAINPDSTVLTLDGKPLPPALQGGGAVSATSGTFARSGNAFKDNDTAAVTSNIARFGTGKFDRAVLIEEGTTNLICNPGFDSGPPGWSYPINMGHTSSKTHYGSQSLAFWSDTPLSTGRATTSNLIPVSPSTTYTLSAWFYNNGFTSGNFYVDYLEFDASNNLITDGGGPAMDRNENYKWHRKSFTFTTKPNASYVQIRVVADGSPAGSAFADQLQLEQKPFATTYTDSTRNAETLTIPTAGVLSAQEGSIELWAYIDPAEVHSARNPSWTMPFSVVTIQGSPYLEKNQISLRRNPSSTSWSIWISNSSGSINTIPLGSITTTGWYQVAVTWKQGVGATGYLNGQIKGTVPSSILPSSFEGNMALGSWSGGSNQFGSTIDDLRISNRVRTADEIASSYSAGVADVDVYTTYKMNLNNDLTGYKYSTSPSSTLSAFVSNLSLGTHTVALSIADTVGNLKSTTWSFDVKDLVPPVISDPSPTGTAIINNSGHTFTAKIDDSHTSIDGTSVRFRLDNGLYASGAYNAATKTISYNYTGTISIGTHTAEFKVKDVAGNDGVYSWNFNRQWIDESTRTPAPASKVGPMTASVKVAPGLSDGYGVNVKLDSGYIYYSYDSSTGIVSIPITGNIASGTHTLEVSVGIWHSEGVCCGEGSSWFDTIQQTTSWTFNLDSKLPVISNIVPADLSHKDPPATFTVSADVSDESGINASTRVLSITPFGQAPITLSTTYIEKDAFSGTIAAQVDNLAEDAYMFTLSIVDNYGNVSSTNWKVAVGGEIVPPVISEQTPANGSYVETAPTIISAKITDSSAIDTSRTVLKVDGIEKDYSYNPSTGIISWTPPVYSYTSTHSVYLQAMDKWGNIATSSWNFTYKDVLAPRVENQTPAPGSVSGPKPKISAKVVDGQGFSPYHIAMKVDGVLVTNFTGYQWSGYHPTSFEVSYTPSSNLATGTHTVEVNAKDIYDNANTVSWTFNADNTAPTISNFTPVENTYIPDPTGDVTVSATVSDSSGIDAGSKAMKLDGNSIDCFYTATDSTTGKIHSTLNNIPPGWHTIYVSVKDEWGNTNEKSWRIRVTETVGPTVTEKAPTGDFAYNNRRPPFQARLTDPNEIDVSSIVLKVNGVKVTHSYEDDSLKSGLLLYTPEDVLPEGANSVEITVKDTLGNKTVETWTFNLGTIGDNVHGTYMDNESACMSCHKTHQGSAQKLINRQTEQQTCYYCHDGIQTGSDLRKEFGETTDGTSTKTSHHKVPEGVTRCSDCHNPHGKPSETPFLLSAGENKVSSGNDFCGVCHESINNSIDIIAHGSTMAMGDLGKTNITCLKCHEEHSSDYPALLRDPVSLTSVISRNINGNNSSFCEGCHKDALGKYSGSVVYDQTKHGTAASSMEQKVIKHTTREDFKKGTLTNLRAINGNIELNTQTGINILETFEDETFNLSLKGGTLTGNSFFSGSKSLLVSQDWGNRAELNMSSYPVTVSFKYRKSSLGSFYFYHTVPTQWNSANTEALYYTYAKTTDWTSVTGTATGGPIIWTWWKSLTRDYPVTLEGAVYIDDVKIQTSSYSYFAEGTYLSPVTDISSGPKTLATVDWDATLTLGSAINIQTNVSLDGGVTWLGWKKPTKGEGIPGITAQTDLSKARLKYKVTFKKGTDGSTPQLHEFKVTLNKDNTNITPPNALKSWPGTDNTGCSNCHDPHGTDKAYGLRATGNTLCTTCHDAPSVNIQSTYAYRGKTAYNKSAHGDTSLTDTKCTNCHNPHGADMGNGTPFASQIKAEEGTTSVCFGASCHSNGTGDEVVYNMQNRFTASADKTSHHNVTGTEQKAGGGTKVQCENCHNPHINNAANPVVDPDNTNNIYNLSNPWAKFVSSDKEVYVLIESAKFYSIYSNQVYLREVTLKATQNFNIDPTGLNGSNAWQGTAKPLSTSDEKPDVSTAGWSEATPANKSALLATETTNRAEWVTSLATVDEPCKYQLFKFKTSEVGRKISNLGFCWVGHYGTDNWAGGSVSIYMWDFTKSGSDKWVGIHSQNTTSFTTTVAINGTKDYRTYCNKCHDNNPPEGVKMGSLTDINYFYKYTVDTYEGDCCSPGWTNYYGDIHGDRSGRALFYWYVYGNDGYMPGGNGQLRSPWYNWGMTVQCQECHDQHGSANPYHLRENINGQKVTMSSAADNDNVYQFCLGCHVSASGTTDKTATLKEFHSACSSCHAKDTYNDPTRDGGGHGDFSTSSEPYLWNFRNCLDCHYHGAEWTTHIGCMDHCTESDLIPFVPNGPAPMF